MTKFEGLDVDALLELFDKDTSEFRFNRTEALKKAFEICEKNKDERLEDIRKDLLLFDLFVQSYPKDRFNPMVIWKTKDGREVGYPDVERDFSEDSVSYYKRRFDQTPNALLKARYSDFLWEYKKDITYAKKAVEAYLESSDIYFNNTWDSELADVLTRGLLIALSINDAELIKKCMDKCNEIISRLLNAKRPRFILEIAEFIIHNNEKLKSLHNLADYIQILEESIAFYRANVDDSFHLQQIFLSLLLNIYTIIDSKQVKAIQLRLILSFVEEADWKLKHYPNGGLVAHSFYQQALKTCQDFGGFDKEAEMIKRKIQGLGAQSEIKYKEIRTEVKVPTKVIDDYINGLKKRATKEIIEILCTDNGLIPNYEKIKEGAVVQAREFVLQHIIPVQIMRGNLCVKSIQEDEAKLEFETISNFMIGYKMMTGMLLTKIFDMIEKEHPKFNEELIYFLKQCSYIKKERLEIIEAGFKSYADKNFISSFHVLVFQIEGILRDMLEGANVPTFNLRENEMRVKLFSNIIDLLKKINGIDRDLIHLIEIFLGRVEGDNLRNDTAHALCDSKSFSRENNLLLILIIIKLAGYKLETKPTPQDS